MNNREIAGLAFNSIRYRSLRSWLAILGIVIGVGSIISLISITEGMSEQMQSSMSGLGANIITVSSGGMRASQSFGGGAPPSGFGGGGPGGAAGGTATTASSITFKEADALRKLPGVEALDARVSGSKVVSYRNKNSTLTVVGVEAGAFPASSGTAIMEGRALSTADTASVVLGASVQSQSFNESMLYKQIKIGGKSFRVVGILNATGSSMMGSSPDRSVFILQKTAKSMFNQSSAVSSIVVLADGGTEPDELASNITATLQKLHRVTSTTQDFTVTTASSMQETISSMTSTLTIFLGGIASISLIVGGIGVANAMFTSVLEQTKYIGLLKSLGARSGAVMKLFLFESCIVSVVGGLLGIGLAFVASAIIASYGLPSSITPGLIALGLGFSLIVGAASGLIPARSASKVAPVEALRYE